MKRGYEGGQGQAAKHMTGGQQQRPGGMQHSQAKLTTSDALSYLREVKNRFADKKDIYDTFLEIMKEFKAQRIDTAGVIQRVKKLFKGHRELILGFNTFLPKGYEIELARVSDDEDEAPPSGWGGPTLGPSASMPRAALPPKEAPGKGQFIQKQPVEFDQAINYVNKIKNRFSTDDRVYKQFLEILNLYRKGQKTIHSVYNEVSVLFRSHSDLLDEFTYFLPDAQAVKDSQRKQQQQQPYKAGAPGARPPFSRTQPVVGPNSAPQHKRKALKPKPEDRAAYYEDDRKSILPRELQYFERVRVRIRSREAYNDLIRCVHMFNVELFTRSELISSVTDILGRFPDLMTGFNDFLNSCDTLELPVPGGPNAALMKQKALLMSKDKMLSKPLSEIVSHETERITPSYVKIPAAYPKLACSGRTGLDLSVLNDTFVNVITGSEDFSFKLMRKNQYEEALFRCEDDRYEFEMCLEVNASAIRIMKPLSERILAMNNEDRHIFRAEDCNFTPVHFKAIETLYGDQGSMMVELLKRSPAFAVPVILPRLEAKDVEWRKVKEEMAKVWKKIYQENYHKSLDHRSFYFKQSEKKLLLPKTMVQEIRDSADRRKQNDLANRLSSGELNHRYLMAPPAVKPDLSFDYSDPVVFEDCWSILRTAVEEAQMSPVHREHVLELYITSVESFFCLPLRSEELAKIKAKTKRAIAAKRDGEGGNEEDEGGVRKRLVIKDDDDQDNLAADMDIDGEGQEAASNGDGENIGEESNDEGHNPLRSYASSKPLSPYMGPDKDKGPAFSDLPSSARVLLANEMMYLFFRYHRHLYDRLFVARKCALQQAMQSSRLNSKGGAGDMGEGGGGSSGGAAEPASEEVREDSGRIHTSFMDMSHQLLKGELEISLYEDQVRTLLGTNSFELFTLDKLLHRLINHMRMMTQDDSTMRLWALYRYEQARAGGVNSFAYHVNSHPILDDSCYRIEFNRDNEKSWTVVLVDPVDKGEINQGAAAMEGPLTDCIRAYIAPPAKPWLDPRPTLAPGHPPLGEDETLDKGGPWRPFLLKNLARVWDVPKSSCTPKTIGAMEDEKVFDALERVVLDNGLECKVSCVHSKVSYVLDTEDLMYHRVRRAGSDVDPYKMTRSSRFLQWYDGAMAKVKAEGAAAEALMVATGVNGGEAPAVPVGGA